VCSDYLRPEDDPLLEEDDLPDELLLAGEELLLGEDDLLYVELPLDCVDLAGE